MTDKPRDGLTLLVEAARGTLLAQALDEAGERQIIAHCRADVRKRTLKIETHVSQKAFRPARREARELRCCLAGRLNALWSSLPKELRDRTELPSSDRAELRVLRWRALSLALSEVGDVDRPSAARLTARPKGTPSATGKRHHRPVFTFDWLDLAKQRLIATSLSPFVDLHSSQYMLRQVGRRGRSAVREALLARLPHMGPNHVFIQLDVKGFHQNIDHEWLEDNLPALSKGIIRSHGHTGGMIYAPVKETVKARLGLSERGAYENLFRRGIPTGSALSALIGEYVMAEVLRGLADHPLEPLICVHSGDFHVYSDNLGVFVERARAAAVVDLLQRAFASSPAGPFTLRAAPPVPARGPFKFLGYWFRVCGSTAETYLPADVAEHEMRDLLQDLLTAGPIELSKMRHRALGKATNWGEGEGVAAWRAEALGQIARAELALAAFDQLAA
jgi:hypothetical protein